jgi:hypothetical protein
MYCSFEKQKDVRGGDLMKYKLKLSQDLLQISHKMNRNTSVRLTKAATRLALGHQHGNYLEIFLALVKSNWQIKLVYNPGVKYDV